MVNETSNFGGKWKIGQDLAPKQLYFSGEGALKASTAEMAGAWPGVTFRRTLVQIDWGKSGPIVLDLLRATGAAPATYDLPLHYAGQITDVGFPLQSNAAVRPVLGKANGYQHIWVDATGTPTADTATLTWINGGTFYTYRMLPPAGATMILGESGANDPRFNLRREAVLIQRVQGAKDATFVSLLEPHGAYDPAAETSVASVSQIRSLHHVRAADADVIAIEPLKGPVVTIAVADDVTAGKPHTATIDGRTVRWTGHIARIEAGPK